MKHISKSPVRGRGCAAGPAAAAAPELRERLGIRPAAPGALPGGRKQRSLCPPKREGSEAGDPEKGYFQVI